jgi:hypothetical protein
MVARLRAMFGSRFQLTVLAVAALCFACVAPSFATATFDYSTAVTAAQAQLVTDITSALGPILLITAVMAGLAWAFRKFKGAVRTR